MDKKYVLKVLVMDATYDERSDDIDVLRDRARQIFRDGFYAASADEITSYIPIVDIRRVFIMTREHEEKAIAQAKEIQKDKPEMPPNKKIIAHL